MGLPAMVFSEFTTFMSTTSSVRSDGCDGTASRAADAGRDEIDHGLDVGGGVPALDGGPDGAAVLVAQHHHKRAVQVLDGVLDAAQNDRIDHVASDADNEDVPQALVEDQFRRDAGVAAADDDGERLLPRDQLLAAGGRDVPGRHRRLDEAGVALPQEGQCLIGCDRRGSDGPRRGAEVPLVQPTPPAMVTASRNVTMKRK